MKLKDAAKCLPLIQAAAEGKTIQINNGSYGREFWCDLDKESDWLFRADSDQCRIKPQEESEAEKFRALWKQGKEVEYSSKGEENWRKVIDLFNFNDNDYLDKNYKFRRVQELKLRPWKPEEVPVGALIRSKGKSWGSRLINSYSHIDGFDYVCYQFGKTFSGDSLENCLARREHSLDHGKTWLPCGVME
jgi:hypothetical protein